MGLFKKKKISLNDFILSYVCFALDFKQIYIDLKDLDDLLLEDIKIEKKSDRPVIEVIYMRMFIVTKIINLIMDKEVSQKVLDGFHKTIYSAIEKGDLNIDINTFTFLLHRRYDEYFKIFEKIEQQDKSKENLYPEFEFGQVLAANILGMKKAIDDYLSIGAVFSESCYIYFINSYLTQAKILKKIKDKVQII